MSVTIPDSVSAEGNVKVVFIPTLASRVAPSIAALNGGTAVDLSCYLMPDWGGVTGEQSVGEDRRFCSREGFDRLGRVKRTIAPLTYTYLPQEDDSDDANAVKAALEEGNTGFLVIGYGLDPAADFATTANVSSIPVECGVQNKNAAAADEFAPLTITQTVGATGIEVDGVTAA